MDFSFSKPRPEAYTGSPCRSRPARSRSSSPSEQDSTTAGRDNQSGADTSASLRTQGGIFPIAAPALLPWKAASQFCRPRPHPRGSEPLTPQADNEDPMLSVAGPDFLQESSAIPRTSEGTDQAPDMAPKTPQRQDHAAQLIDTGLMTPPETPRDEVSKSCLSVSLVDPFTPPATPGDAYERFSLPQDDEAGSTCDMSPSRAKGQRVRFASPAPSARTHTWTPSSHPHDSSLSTVSTDEPDDDDSASSISTLDEYGISSPSSPDLAAKDASRELSEFDFWASAYKDRIPKPARTSCAQCLSRGLPCNRAMPSCARCTRRAAQHDANALSSATPGKALAAADACCVPMLQAHALDGTPRPLPIFKAYADCTAHLAPGADLAAARAHIDAARRAAFDALLAADAARAARANWVLPRLGAEALALAGRQVALRPDGRVVLRRDPGVDGPSAGRSWAADPFARRAEHF